MPYPIETKRPPDEHDVLLLVVAKAIWCAHGLEPDHFPAAEAHLDLASELLLKLSAAGLVLVEKDVHDAGVRARSVLAGHPSPEDLGAAIGFEAGKSFFENMEQKHAADAARELGEVFEALARTLKEALVDHEHVIDLAAACDGFFLAYRAMIRANGN